MKLSIALPALAGFSLVVLSMSACRSDPGVTQGRGELLDRYVPGLLSEYKVAGAGVAIIAKGEIAWTGYYGEQGPGVPATARTIWNSASVEKTVTAETMLALAAKGLISLDEPIHTFVSDPDLAKDPRYKKLTSRLLLSHRAGLLNWPYEYKDGHAAFIAEPGTTFSYSGMGVELAAKYAQKKLGKDFEALATEYVLQPAGVTELSMGRLKPWMQNRLATPMNATGTYTSVGESNPRLSGQNPDTPWSGADDLMTTVDEYARFLVHAMKTDRLSQRWQQERLHIQTSLAGDAIWNCVPAADVKCANAYGHSLGWMVYEFDDKTIIKHGGNDQGENALVIYSPQTRNGAVIFINGGNGVMVSTQILGLIGTEPEITAYYRQLVKKFYNVDLPQPPSSRASSIAHELLAPRTPTD